MSLNQFNKVRFKFQVIYMTWVEIESKAFQIPFRCKLRVRAQPVIIAIQIVEQNLTSNLWKNLTYYQICQNDYHSFIILRNHTNKTLCKKVHKYERRNRTLCKF